MKNSCVKIIKNQYHLIIINIEVWLSLQRLGCIKAWLQQLLFCSRPVFLLNTRKYLFCLGYYLSSYLILPAYHNPAELMKLFNVVYSFYKNY